MNVKKGIIDLLIFPLFIISMMPLSVHADTTTNTAPFIGVNIQVTGYGENQTSITYPALNINEISANQSSAYIHGQLNCTSPSTPTSSVPCDVFSFANNNGNSSPSYGTAIDLNLQNYFLKFNGNATVNGINYFFVDYEFILDDNYKGYVTVTDENSVSKTIYVNGNSFHYQRMQDDLTQHTFTITDYELTRVTNSILWDIPFESLLVVTYFNSYHDPEYIYTDNIYDAKYPIYKMNGRSFRLYGYSGHQYKMIVLSKSSTTSDFNQKFSISPSTGFSLTASSYSGNTYFFRQSYLYLMTYTFTCTSTGNYYFDYVGADENYYVVPIYYGDVNNKNISTEFAEKYGLSNIPTSVASSDQQNDTFKDQANDLVTQEQQFTSDMKQNLQQINTNFTFNNFGNKFMSSAVWVRDQYDHMITNTPFGTLVTFSMLLGLGLLIIGRTVNK